MSRPSHIPPLRWSVAVTTAPRSPATLTASLLSIRDAGWPYATVFADSGMQLGPWGNLRQAANVLADRLYEFDAFLIFQDDVQVTRGLRKYLDDDAGFRSMMWTPHAGVVSLYCAGPNHDEQAAAEFKSGLRTWHPTDPVPTKAYGALAYVFSRSSLMSLLKWPCPNDKAPADWLIGCFCRDAQKQYMTHSPSFVRHTGEVSSLPEPGGIPECRQCLEFITEAPRNDEG